MLEETNHHKRGCPLTCGGPISMTRHGFELCCAAKRKQAEEDVEARESGAWRGISFIISFKYACLTCTGPPPDLTIIDLENFIKTTKEEKGMNTTANTLKDLNSKLFSQLDRLADDKLTGDALNSEINRARAVTDIACQIISVGSLALKAKIAFRGNAQDGKVPAMLEG